MRWLLVTPEFPPDTGGVARYLGVSAAGSDDWLVVASPHGPVALDAASWFKTLWRVPSLIRKTGSDRLLVSHVLPFGYAALVSRLLGTRYAIVCHGLDVAGPLANPWKRFWAGAVLRHAETVIVNSEATGSVVRLYGVKDEIIKTVNPPLSWDPGAVNLDEETGLAGRLGLRGRRILLVAGRLVGRKGVHVAIGALKTITTRHPETVLLVAGDGPERGSLEKIAKDRALESSVIFTGRLSDAEFRDAFRAATIVLYPSLDLPNDLEGFGIGAADAGIFGKPVVASRIGGLPEAVQDGETGLLVEPGDPDALAVAVIRLLEEDGLASKLGEGGRRLALTRTHESFRQRFRDSLLPKT